MTMRLDIVTNDAGELVRREHARDLGAGVVVAIYRLAKLAQVHDLHNQAFIRQLEQTHQIIGDYCLRSGSNVNVLFAHKATFVAGQLLKGNRGAYIAAQELGELFEALGGSELFIQRDLTRDELNSLAEQISNFYRQGAAVQFRSPTPKIRLRRVADAARLRGIELESLSADQRIVRAYASAVVIMRRFFEDLQNSRYILPRRIKRIAQSLVDLSDASTAAFLGVTEVRNANFDEAGRAVNTAILAVAIAREATHERTTLAQIAMAAMMHDVARPRALALAGGGEPGLPGMAGPSVLSEDQEDRLAAGAAAVLTALGRVNEPSITRTVLTYESLWLRRQTWLGPVYWGARAPTLHASMIAVSRRYNDLLTPEPGLPPKTPDFAVATLASELQDPQDRTVLRMLVSALGLLPTGTLVQLSTGEVAEVTRGARGPFDKPCVNVVADANGAPFAQSFEVELAQDPRRTVLRVLSVDGWQKGLEQGEGELQPARDSEAPEAVDVGMKATDPPPPSQHAHAVPPPARSIADQYAEQYASWGDTNDANSDVSDERRRDSGSSIQSASMGSGSGEHNSSQSLPSMGSSPSAVAEAMGRMIHGSLRPPLMMPREGDRTVLQPAVEGAPRRAPRNPATASTPTARGNLAATPLPHVLVYMLDHALTGSVVFEGTGSDDAIYFVHGVPAKVRLGEPVALLGEMLVRSGAIDVATIEEAALGARHLGILLGEYLVGHDLVTREALAWALEAQLLQKVAALANLAPEITYAYYRDVDLLEGAGGEGPVTHPLNPILASVRHWHDRARVRATLNRVGKHSLVVHPDSDLSNLAVLPEEQTVLDAIGMEPVPLAQLFKRQLAEEETVSSLVYALAVTRQFAFKGQKKGPMAARGAAWRTVSNTPGPTPSPGSAPPSLGTPLPTPVSSSGTRPTPQANMPTPVRPAIAAGAVAGGGPSIDPGRSVTPAPVSARNVPAPSAPMRAGPPPSPTQTGSLRPVAPAVRPARATGASAPQIRPIAKKASASGQRAAPPSPAPERSSVREPVASSAPPADASRSSFPPDDAKTIAMPVGQALKDLVGARAAALPKTSPRLPSMQTGPGSTNPGPTNPGPTNPGPAPREPPPSAFKAKAAKPIEIDFDIEGSSSNAFQIDDGGLADAEAALEAMQNFRLAEAALQRGDIAEAEALAQKAVSGDPSQHDYVTLLFWLRASGGDPATSEEAIHRMSKILIEDPSNERALLYRGKLLVRTNRLHEALADFTELLSTNPHHREAANEARSLKTRLG